jgi:alpha-beta hydrolase superfamily lysophospholipase
MVLPRPRYAEGFFKNRRAQQLFYSAFFPENSATEGVEGVVLFMHGINEHSQRFTHVYERLVAHRFGVIAYDMVSHGRSECDVPGLRGHAENFHHMVDDTNDFLTIAKYSVLKDLLPPVQQHNAVAPPPLFFMGISYGCLVGLHTMLSGEHPFSGMLMAAPALGVELTLTLRIQNLFAAPMVWAFPHARIVPGVNLDGTWRIRYFALSMGLCLI